MYSDSSVPYETQQALYFTIGQYNSFYMQQNIKTNAES